MGETTRNAMEDKVKGYRMKSLQCQALDGGL